MRQHRCASDMELVTAKPWRTKHDLKHQLFTSVVIGQKPRLTEGVFSWRKNKYFQNSRNIGRGRLIKTHDLVTLFF